MTKDQRLMGVYIALFFIVAQLVAIIAFHERLRLPIVVGGAFIIAGGLIMTLWQSAAAVSPPSTLTP